MRNLRINGKRQCKKVAGEGRENALFSIPYSYDKSQKTLMYQHFSEMATYSILCLENFVNKQKY